MTHSNTNPRSGQSLTHAHSHITREKAAWTAVSALLGLIKAEKPAHGCHYPGDMAAGMRKVLTRPWAGVGVCHLLLLLFYWRLCREFDKRHVSVFVKCRVIMVE